MRAKQGKSKLFIAWRIYDFICSCVGSIVIIVIILFFANGGEVNITPREQPKAESAQ